MKRIRGKMGIYLLQVACIGMLVQCSSDNDFVTDQEEVDNTTSLETITGNGATVATSMSLKKKTHEVATDYEWDANTVTDITFSSGSITVTGSGASVVSNIVTITASGNYTVHGTHSDAQLRVNTDDDGIVRLILSGLNITSSTTAPIFVENAEKTIVILAANTQNYVTDAGSYVFESADTDEPNAAIFSKDDLTIYGTGSLTIDANYGDAIASKDGLLIKSGTISINAVDDGIRGKDYLIVSGGTVSITSGGDGLTATNDESSAKGYILINDGSVTITSGGDGIAATTDFMCLGGSFSIISGGGSSSYIGSDASAKGIKAVANIIIDGGSFTINAADDALHSDSLMTINSGTYAFSTADDGMYADSILEINGGIIDIKKSYEGIESAIIIVNDGELLITASDDGVNAAGGSSTETATQSGGPMKSSGNFKLYINGGYIYNNASGDGLDVNGTCIMTGGTVLVDGPAENNNASLDYDGSFAISGGYLVATGSSGMAQAPGTSSTQYSILANFSSTMQAGTLVSIVSSDNVALVTFKPTKRFQSIAFSSPLLKSGATYSVYYGGSSSGVATNGLYESTSYTPGTLFGTITISSVITTLGNSSRF